MIAFARGAWDRSPDDPNTHVGKDRVEHAGELRIPVTDQELELRHAAAEVHHQVPRLLSDPVRSGMCGDAKNMDPAGHVLDNGETVQPGEEHRVAVEEVAGQKPSSWSTQELAPSRTQTPWTRINSGPLEDGPHRRCADPLACTSQLSGDAPISPGRVLTGHTQDYSPDRWPRGWPPRSSPPERPPPPDLDHGASPPRAGGDKQMPSMGRGQYPGPRAEDGAIRP